MKPFLQGRKTLPAAALRFPHLPTGATPRVGDAVRVHAQTGEGQHQANVEVVKEGDKVARLIVTCGCGEKIEIDCIYPVGS